MHNKHWKTTTKFSSFYCVYIFSVSLTKIMKTIYKQQLDYFVFPFKNGTETKKLTPTHGWPTVLKRLLAELRVRKFA